MDFINNFFISVLRFLIRLVLRLVDYVLSPVYAGIATLLPNFYNMFTYFTNFIGILQQPFKFVCHSLLITQDMTAFLFSVFAFKLELFVFINTFLYVIKIWQYFKGGGIQSRKTEQ